MNTKNNKRRRESCERIEKAFSDMILTKDIQHISVTDICKAANLNRTTFYANYIDIYDVADKICEKIESDFNAAFNKKENHTALTLFNLIYENQTMFKIYFKLGYDERHTAYIYDIPRAEQDFNIEHINYHIEFFKSGLNAIIKLWLKGGCKETPQEMATVVSDEYHGRKR